jgi:hypothetical protein
MCITTSVISFGFPSNCSVSFLFLTMITVQLQIAIHMLHSEHMQIDELYPLISSRLLMLLVNEICVHQVHEIVIEKYM